ncbi:MAG: hypothetical protein ACXAEF_16505, partial [Candidatus Thorarchaeota archaeon]
MKKKWLRKRYRYEKIERLRKTVEEQQRTRKPATKSKQKAMKTAIWGTAISSYLDHPIKSKRFRKRLEKRAENFEVEGNETPLKLIPNEIYDIGSHKSNSVTIMALLDLSENEDLVEYVKQEMDMSDFDNNLQAAFTSRQQFPGRLPDDERQFLVVQNRISVLVPENGGKRFTNVSISP